jgi:hypothetical protein
MTDRAKAFLVHIDDDYRMGDWDSDSDMPVGADFIAALLRGVKGVVKVEPLLADYDHAIAVERAKRDLREKMRGVLWDLP